MQRLQAQGKNDYHSVKGIFGTSIRTMKRARRFLERSPEAGPPQAPKTPKVQRKIARKRKALGAVHQKNAVSAEGAQPKAPKKTPLKPKNPNHLQITIKNIQSQCEAYRKQLSGKNPLLSPPGLKCEPETSFLASDQQIFDLANNSDSTQASSTHKMQALPQKPPQIEQSCPFSQHYDYYPDIYLSQDYKRGLDPRELLERSLIESWEEENEENMGILHANHRFCGESPQKPRFLGNSS